jgi:exopolysaccharide biosynthesis polyprenyl glycosylphosphotransferase
MNVGGDVDVAVEVVSVRPSNALTAVSSDERPAVKDGPAGWALRWAGVLGGCLVGLVAAAAYGQEAGAAVVGLALWTAILGVQSSLRHTVDTPGTSRQLHAATISFAVVAAAAAGDVLPARGLTGALLALGVGVATTAAWSAVHHVRRTPVRALVVGDRTATDAQVALWSSQPGVEVAACYEPTGNAEDDGTTGGRLASLVTSLGIDTVIVAPGSHLSAHDLQRLSWALESTRATIVVGGIVDRFAPHRLAASTLGGVPVLAVGSSRRGRLQHLVKAVLDRVGAAVLLLLAAPVLAAMIVAVRLESPGPALFKQRRVGQSGRAFVMYKMRTMYTSGGTREVTVPLQRTAGNEVLFKMRNDPRVTRVGDFLRKYSLDELPQLINVFRGEMSLIGPRPALFEETHKYDSRAWRRTAVKPGITGLWQVSGRSDLSWEKSISLDLHYVDNWRLTDDLYIAARTLWAVLSKKGAY